MGRVNHSDFGKLVVFGTSWLHLTESLWWNLFEQLHSHSDFRSANDLPTFLLTYHVQEWCVSRVLDLTLSDKSKIAVIWWRFFVAKVATKCRFE